MAPCSPPTEPSVVGTDAKSETHEKYHKNLTPIRSNLLIPGIFQIRIHRTFLPVEDFSVASMAALAAGWSSELPAAICSLSLFLSVGRVAVS